MDGQALISRHAAFCRVLKDSERTEMITIIETALTQAEKQSLPLKIPQETALLQKIPGLHFHFKPEVFLQLQGHTNFTFPRETMRVNAGDLCVVPAGLPHKEEVSGSRDAEFRNLVIGFYSHAVSLHFAREVAPTKPDIEVIEFFDAPDLDIYLTLTNHLVQVHHTHTPARRQMLKGHMISLLGMLLNLLKTSSDSLNQDIGKVFWVKWLVREQLSNTKLNVKGIAETLQCSADYLSHLFHEATGERLIHYIQRIRVEGAARALQNTHLYVSEIAWSCGFADPAYFARVFKKFTGMSPQDYRSREAEKRRLRESDPKTIYYDRVDFTGGAAVDEEAVAR